MMAMLVAFALGAVIALGVLAFYFWWMLAGPGSRHRPPKALKPKRRITWGAPW